MPHLIVQELTGVQLGLNESCETFRTIRGGYRLPDSHNTRENGHSLPGGHTLFHDNVELPRQPDSRHQNRCNVYGGCLCKNGQEKKSEDYSFLESAFAMMLMLLTIDV